MKTSERQLSSQALDILQKLKDTSENEVLEFIQVLKLNSNHIRDFYQLLNDLEVKHGKKKSDIINELELIKIINDPHIPLNQKIDRIKSMLTKKLYSTFTSYQEKIENLVKKLALPPYLSLELPPYFEGNEVKLILDLSKTSMINSREVLAIVNSTVFKEIVQTFNRS